MKPKDFYKKLSLKKKTIANLGNGEMAWINGGGPDIKPASDPILEICPSDYCTQTCTCVPSNCSGACC